MKKTFVFILIFGFFLALGANAQLNSDTWSTINQEANDAANEAGFESGGGEVGLSLYVENIITAFLSLLGVIFIILMILAGYNWMTAGGDEQKVTKAKDTIKRAIIGLLIIMGAYAITYFVFANVPYGGGGSSYGSSFD